MPITAFTAACRFGRAALLPMALLLLACSTSPESPRDSRNSGRNPWLVVGIDGAEWRVIERLWAEDDLPHLKALAARGTRSVFKTAYSTSPVIWTTLATGHLPETHGITGFTVATERGEVPVSSSVRKVPALWNIAGRAGLKTAVLGWWASWPAEDVDGMVISDRALRPLDKTFSPEAMAERIERWKLEASELPNPFGGNLASSERDRLMSHVVRQLDPRAFDLTLLYYRSVDIESHNSWKYFEPEKFGIRPAEHLAHRERIPDAYRAVDAAIGAALEHLPADTNVIVISDHGFIAKDREEVQILVEMNRVLERLGYVTLLPNGKPDLTKSRVYSFGTAKNRRPKRLRFNLKGREEPGLVTPEERDAVRAALTADLARITYTDGSPIFLVRDADAREQRNGTDFEALVLGQGAGRPALLDGRPVDGLVEHVNRVSGTHTPSTHGVLIAAGPDIQANADIDGISIFDFAPSLLYGLGLPVADDFEGRPFLNLFTPEFQGSRPLRRISSWGTMETWKQSEGSPVDQELLDELQSLGYI